MKKTALCIVFVLLLVITATSARAQVYYYNPLALPFVLGAFGAALGFSIAGDVVGAALGGATGLTAGLLFGPPHYAYASYYGPPPYPRTYVAPPAAARPRYSSSSCGPGSTWVPAHRNRYGEWVPRSCRRLVWVPGRYTSNGLWVPGHPG